MIVFLLSMFAWAGGGDWVGNGASLSENRILLAFGNIEHYIEASLEDATHPLEEDQRVILQKMLKDIPNEKKLNQSMIQFKPHSPLFIIDGKIKVAVTGLNLGDEIYFNQDFIHFLDDNKTYNELSLIQAISLLIHELGHHQGIKDHTFLDQLGAAVANQARFEEYWLSIFPQNKNLGAQLLTPKEGVIGSSTLHLVDRNKHFDITERIRKYNLCKTFKSGNKMGHLNFWNLYWDKPLSQTPRLVGLLVFNCQMSDGDWVTRVGDQIVISPQLEKINGEFVFSSENLRIDISPCENEGAEMCSKAKELYFKNKNK